MCGISGIIYKKSDNIKDQIKNISNAISSRGPDGTNIFINENIVLSHNRLAILDRNSKLSIQPVFDQKKRYAIIHNGEIYNYKIIKKELINLGHKFVSETDTEIILNSFIQWGNDCVYKFEGMWAFAIWDNKNKSLFLSRDEFGIKPLYYANYNDNFYFSSEIKGLKNIKILSEINKSILKRFEFNEYQEETIYKNIFNLLPGHSIIVQNKKINKFKWRKEKNQNIDDIKLDSIKKFDLLLEESCFSHSIGERSIALSLSGGLDSTALFYKLNHLGLKVNAFSTIYENTYNDESKYLDIIERDLNIKIERNIVTKEDLNSKNFIESIKALDLIWSEPCIGQWLHYKKINEKGFNVCIEGHGADEILGGYDYHFDEFIKDSFKKNIFFNLKNLNKEKKIIFSSPDDNSFDQSKFNLLNSFYKDFKNALRNKFENTKFFNLLLKKKINFNNQKDYTYIKKKYLNIFNSKFDCFNSKLHEDVYYGNMSRHLSQFDRLSMSSGIELRVPFLNKKLINHTLGLDQSYKINNGFNKKILRDAMSSYLPREIVKRKEKIGFSTPMKDIIKTNIIKFIMETSRNKSFLEASYWDGKEISKNIEKYYLSNNDLILKNYWKVINAFHLLN